MSQWKLCILLMGGLWLFASVAIAEPAQGTTIMECEYCSSLDVKMYLKDGRFYARVELAPDILKLDIVSWRKVLKKVREEEKYKNVRQTIRFMPFEMPSNLNYRPDIHTSIVKDWRENTTICLVLFKCIFVMSHEVAKDMLWQLKGESTASKMVIELVLNAPTSGQAFYCFFPLVKQNEKEQDDDAPMDAKEYMLLIVGNRNITSSKDTSTAELLQQTEIRVDGWVPTPNQESMKEQSEVWVPTTQGGSMSFGESDDAEGNHFEPEPEPDPGGSRVK